MKIVFRVGPHDSRRTGAKGGFTSTNNPATAAKQFKDFMTLAIRNKAETMTEEILDKKMGLIQKDVVDDLLKYSKQATKFFFSLKSSKDRDLLISMNQFQDDPFMDNQLGLGWTTHDRSKDTTIRWAPLSPKTIKNKKGDRTYFIHEGVLLLNMNDLGPKLQRIIHPVIAYNPPKDGKRGRILVTLLASKRGQSISNLPFLGMSGMGSSINDLVKMESSGKLLQRYMGDLVARKLLNVGKGDRPVRDMFTPIIAWWVLSRYPIIVSRALNKHIGKLKD